MIADFIDPMSTLATELELAKGKVKKTDQGTTAILEDFETSEAQKTALRVGHLLRTTYPQYGWVVRTFGGRKHVEAGNWKVEPLSIGFTCSALNAHGGSKVLQYLNPADYSSTLEFEAKVKKLGGELLERARLTRTKRVKDVGEVTKIPDGFEDLVPQKKKRYVEAKSIDHFVQLCQENINLRLKSTEPAEQE